MLWPAMQPPDSPAARECLLFVYGSLRSGQREHALLAGATLVGPAQTRPAFYLVDLGQYAAMVPGGTTSVVGELYRADVGLRSKLDVAREVPVLFRRERVQLEGETWAEAYVMTADQVRGRRRLAHGDWAQRFSPGVSARVTSPLVDWAKNRFPKR